TLPVTLSETTRNRRHITREVQVVSQQERLAALPLVSSIQLPTTDERVEQAIHVVAQQSPTPDRQLINTRKRETMWSIKLRNAIFENSVGRIQITNLFTKIRIGVSGIHRHAGCEALVDLQLKRVVTIAAVVLLSPEINELWKSKQRLSARYRAS